VGSGPHAQHLRPGAVSSSQSRRGPKKAILAVAASILEAAYYILKNDLTYRELGADYFERRDKAQITRRLIRRLERLGLSVEVRPAA